MGQKLMWLGLTILVALSVLLSNQVLMIVGAIIMIVGCVLYLLDR